MYILFIHVTLLMSLAVAKIILSLLSGQTFYDVIEPIHCTCILFTLTPAHILSQILDFNQWPCTCSCSYGHVPRIPPLLKRFGMEPRWLTTTCRNMDGHIWAPSSEFVSSSIRSWQILTAHAQPVRGARDLAFCLKVPLDSLLVWVISEGSGETARMHRLA